MGWFGRQGFLVLAACALCACGGDSNNDAPADARPDAVPDARENRGPIANAGPDATTLIGAPISLDGTASMDPDGTLVSFQWSVETAPAGSTAVVTSATSDVAMFAADKVGAYTFALVVTDDAGATARDTVSILVEPGAFTVDAGPDQTVVWHSTVQLAGAYVSESGPGTVKWTFVQQPGSPAATPVPATSLTPTFYAEYAVTYIAKLEVTSPAGTLADTVTITVIAPPPDLIPGDIVDVEPGFAGQFMIASVNPPRVRLLEAYWPTPPAEIVFPLSVTPTAIGAAGLDDLVSVLHDSTRLSIVPLGPTYPPATHDLGVPILDVRHGSASPRVYPAQAGPLLLVDPQFGNVFPGGAVPGPSRGRELPTAERPLYALDIGPAAKLRRYDGTEVDTPFVREWPYPGGQFPLGNDLWLVSDSTLIVATGHVFNVSETASLDMTHSTFLAGDQPFEIVGVRWSNWHIVTLANRIAAPLPIIESQVRFYDRTTLALKQVVTLPDVVVGGVAQPSLGLALTSNTFPNRFAVIARAGTTGALFTIPEPP